MRNYDEDIRKAKERLKKLEEQKAQQEIRMYVTIGKACVAVFGDSLIDMKQKDVETYLGIFREDRFSGGELIEWYAKYLKLRFSDLPEKEESHENTYENGFENNNQYNPYQ